MKSSLKSPTLETLPASRVGLVGSYRATLARDVDASRNNRMLVRRAEA